MHPWPNYFFNFINESIVNQFFELVPWSFGIYQITLKMITLCRAEHKGILVMSGNFLVQTIKSCLSSCFVWWVQFYTFDIISYAYQTRTQHLSAWRTKWIIVVLLARFVFFKCEVETTYVRRAGSNGRNRTNKNNNIDIEAFILHTFWDLKTTV